MEATCVSGWLIAPYILCADSMSLWVIQVFQPDIFKYDIFSQIYENRLIGSKFIVTNHSQILYLIPNACFLLIIVVTKHFFSAVYHFSHFKFILNRMRLAWPSSPVSSACLCASRQTRFSRRFGSFVGKMRLSRLVDVFWGPVLSAPSPHWGTEVGFGNMTQFKTPILILMRVYLYHVRYVRGDLCVLSICSKAWRCAPNAIALSIRLLQNSAHC